MVCQTKTPRTCFLQWPTLRALGTPSIKMVLMNILDDFYNSAKWWPIVPVLQFNSLVRRANESN